MMLYSAMGPGMQIQILQGGGGGGGGGTIT